MSRRDKYGMAAFRISLEFYIPKQIAYLQLEVYMSFLINII